MSEFRVLDLKSIVDSRGTLTVMQDALPFEVRRVFWVANADGQLRGNHRHHVTRQGLVAVAGSIEIYVNDGKQEERVRLSEPSRCLLVEPEDWHSMRFGAGSILLVFASHHYDSLDYITEKY